MNYIIKLLNKYKKRGLLIDTNLLILFIIGQFDISLIRKNKRTKTYTVDDYQILISILNMFNKVITTPNILTEVSNLIHPIDRKYKHKIFIVFRHIINSIDEDYINSKKVSSSNIFHKFGLTDCAITTIPKNTYLILTDDLNLYGYLISTGRAAINFNHLRSIDWLTN